MVASLSAMAAGIAIISVNLHPVFLASDEAQGSMSLILRFYSDTNVTNSENLHTNRQQGDQSLLASGQFFFRGS
jgi:hypothetical protein